ncbi:MAG: hypothetical protein VYC34_04215 [Planctomycetota bacterium]|nr:hypothetical protein [Planctomycetota bacterium]
MQPRIIISWMLIAAIAALPTLSIPIATTFASMSALCGSDCAPPTVASCAIETAKESPRASSCCAAPTPEHSDDSEEQDPPRDCDSCPIMCAWCCKTLTLTGAAGIRFPAPSGENHRLINEATPAGRALDPPPHPPREC